MLDDIPSEEVVMQVAVPVAPAPAPAAPTANEVVNGGAGAAGLLPTPSMVCFNIMYY